MYTAVAYRDGCMRQHDPGWQINTHRPRYALALEGYQYTLGDYLVRVRPESCSVSVSW